MRVQLDYNDAQMKALGVKKLSTLRSDITALVAAMKAVQSHNVYFFGASGTFQIRAGLPLEHTDARSTIYTNCSLHTDGGDGGDTHYTNDELFDAILSIEEGE